MTEAGELIRVMPLEPGYKRNFVLRACLASVSTRSCGAKLEDRLGLERLCRSIVRQTLPYERAPRDASGREAKARRKVVDSPPT